MTDGTQMTKAELLANIDQGWNDFQSYLASLTYEQVTIPTDPAGWSAKDHIVHLAVWEDTVNALLDRELRWQHLGVDRDLWESSDWDQVNAIIQQRYKNISIADLRPMFFGIHERLIGKINALSDADLQRPYREYQSDSSLDVPIIHWMIIDTYQHYDEHKDYIGVIVQPMKTLSKAQLLDAIKSGWDTLNAYLDSLSDEQLTKKTDAGGWTVKDHAIHLAIWEDGIYALLERLMRVEYMGIDEQTWEHGDNDQINAIIQQRYKDLSWPDVQQKRQHIHQRLIDKIALMTDEDLQRPYRYYELASMEDAPVIGWIVGNTFAHYADHLPWIKAIAEKS